MTAPRQILPGTTYLVTRRCAQRQFLLRPSQATNDVFRYVLAVASQRFGVRVHAYCVLSNHFHLIVTDPGARLPAFEQYLDSLVARALNASLGRWESFWAPSSYSAVALHSPEDIVEKAAYVLANPVAAGLVRSGRDWPGLWSAPEQLDAGAVPARRPGSFFRQGGSMPDSAELELTSPPGFDSPADYRDRLVAALAACEERAAATLASQGRGFMGVTSVLVQKPTARPTPGEPRRKLRPRVAGRDKWKRVEALSRLVDFLRSYREAWVALRAGARDVLFPAGTYWLRVAYGVRCAAPG
jgi:REP element-mobilizing transposase RayT